jgi:hypothetical protein
MAKKSVIKAQAAQISDDPTVNPQNVISDTLMTLDENWAAQFVMWAYGTTPANFWAANQLAYYRGIDLGVFDVDQLKTFFEPDLKRPPKERANLIRSDFRQSPLVHSLNMIIQKNIESMAIELSVSGSDKLSLEKKAAQKLKIKNRRNFLDIVNFIKRTIGDEPYDNDTNIDQIGLGEEVATESLSLMDSIKNEATTDWDFNALNEAGALKDGVEISHEEMMAYYFNATDFKENVSPKIISDFMKINGYAYRFYTSAVNGLPRVQYIDPSFLQTSNFYHRNGDDMDWWYYTETVTWATYMQMVGGKQSPEKNKLIYEYNRNTWYQNVPNYPAFPQTYTGYNSFSTALLNTYIRIGYFEAKKHVYNESTGKYADIIRKFYFLPFGVGGAMQSEYILDLGNLQDTYRYGFNLKDAAFSLIVYRDFQRQSFYDVQQGDFLRLNIIYNQYLNTLANFIPEGVAFAEETIRELAEEIMTEEEERMKSQGQDTTSLSLQSITQDVVRNYVMTGRGVFKLRKGDNDEQRLDRPTFIMENKILFDLEGLIKQMFSIYNTMLIGLGINQGRLGQDPKQHQTLTGIEMATNASYFSTQNLEESYTFAIKSFGERMLYYDQNTITEFNSKGEPTTERAQEMKAILGTKGVTWLEVYKDMPYQNCILTVTNSTTVQDRLQLMELTAQYEQSGKVPAGTLLMAMGIPNFKLAKLYVVFAIKRQERINAENAEKMMQIQGQQQEQAFLASQSAEQQKLEQEGQIQARLTALENSLKTQGQIDVKDKTNSNRLVENQQQTELNIQQEKAKKDMETY